MPNIEITKNTSRDVVVWEPVFDKDTVTFAAAATLKAGTILARDSSTLKLVPYVKGGTTNENGIPKAVIREELEATAAGDLPVSVIVGGRVRKGDLVIDADGDASNVDAAVTDLLRDFTIVAQSTAQLSEFDNE